MSYFPDNDHSDGRQYIHISGRGYFVTDSTSVEFTCNNQRERYPLAAFAGNSGNGSTIDFPGVFGFQIEADGFIVLNPGAKYSFLETAPYQRFEFHALDVQVLNFYVAPLLPPPVAVNVLQAGIPAVSGYYGLQVLFTDGTSQAVYLPTGQPSPTVGETITALVARGALFTLPAPVLSVSAVQPQGGYTGFNGYRLTLTDGTSTQYYMPTSSRSPVVGDHLSELAALGGRVTP